MNAAPRLAPGTAQASPAARKLPDRRRIVRRRRLVGVGKRLLPVLALLLLSLVALWPEWSSDGQRARLSAHFGASVQESGQMVDARYHGVDDRGRPYMITAESARQSEPDRIEMTGPRGDVGLESGSWLLGEAQRGVYLPRAGSLDLSGEVILYRDDGTTLRTDVATMDLKAGAAASAAMTHVEGPFGTLDAQGFSLVDRGEVVRFPGPGRLILNGRK